MAFLFGVINLRVCFVTIIIISVSCIASMILSFIPQSTSIKNARSIQPNEILERRGIRKYFGSLANLSFIQYSLSAKSAKQPNEMSKPIEKGEHLGSLVNLSLIPHNTLVNNTKQPNASLIPRNTSVNNTKQPNALLIPRKTLVNNTKQPNALLIPHYTSVNNTKQPNASFISHSTSIKNTKKPNRTPKRKREGKYRGSPGEHAFFHAKQRTWDVDPEVVKMYCKDTNYTQCNKRPRRSDSERSADRAARRPFNVVDYIPFPYDKSPNFEGCNYDNCVYKGHNVTKETDAIFVYEYGKEPPSVRFPHQTFIFSTMESPANIPGNSPWAKVFNATMTYKHYSDIPSPYGKLDFQPRPKEKLPDYRNIAKIKTRTAVWLVSNCDAPSNRSAYVKEMKKYIDIDIFGRCGLPCELSNELCISDFSTTYKFYLAFENNICSDYVTEKFFKVFIDDSHIIPVARGGFDYNQEFPNKTFVNAADFESPRDLAMFLKRLGQDEEMYSEYLKTKDMYRAVRRDLNWWCGLCEYLHTRPKVKEGAGVNVNLDTYNKPCGSW